MKLVDAVYKRVIDLCNENNISLYRLSKNSCVPYSTIATMTRSKTVQLSTIIGICDGLNITLVEFFDSGYFLKSNLEY